MRTHPDIGLVIADLLQHARFWLCIVCLVTMPAIFYVTGTNHESSKYVPNMNKFCDWFSETKMISVHDSFF